MSNHLTDTLDIALDRLKADEPVPDILVDQPARIGELEPLLQAASLLQNLAPIEMPITADWQVDRQQYLAKVAHVRPQDVPAGRFARLQGWVAHTLPEQLSLLIYPWQKQRRLSALLVMITLILVLIFGSLGSTAVLAAGSLPDSPLYPLKLAMEQTRLALASQPEDQADLHLSLAQVRAREMAELALAGEVPDAATLSRLQQHLDQSLNLAAQMPDEPMLGLLTRARRMVQTQQRQLVQTRVQVNQPAGAALGQAAELLNQANQDIEMGLQDPHTFRWRHTHPTLPESLPQPSISPGPDTNRPGGRPDCPTGDCPPANEEHRTGQAGDTLPPETGQPGDNSQQPCDGDHCQPAGDEHHSGQAGDTLPPGGGQPGDNSQQPCDSGHCRPAGDQHHPTTQPDPSNGNTGGNLIGPGGGGGHSDAGDGSDHDNGGDHCCQDNHSSDGNHSGPRR